MLIQFTAACHRYALGLALGLAVTCAAGPALAQSIQTVDPDAAPNGDLISPGTPPAQLPTDLPPEGVARQVGPVGRATLPKRPLVGPGAQQQPQPQTHPQTFRG